MPIHPRNLATWSWMVIALMLVIACPKPTPMLAAMRDLDDSFDKVRKLVDKDPAGARTYAADMAKILSGPVITGSDLYKRNEGFRDLTTQSLDALGRLQGALSGGSPGETTGAVSEVKSLCDSCHKQHWPR